MRAKYDIFPPNAKRLRFVLLAVTLLLAGYRVRVNLAQEPLRRPNRTRPVLDRSAMMKEAKLGRLLGGLRQIVPTVVTDLNDEFNTLSQKAGTLQRQKTLIVRNMPSGYGMKRWSPEMFNQRLDEAHRTATQLLGQYRKILPCVGVTIGEEQITFSVPSQPIRLLAGRSDYLLLEITNQTPNPRGIEISGQVAGKPIPWASTVAVPRSESYLLVPVRAENPGDVAISLTCTSQEQTVKQDLDAVATPSHRLTLSIVNAGTGKPCAARAYVRGSDGRCFVAFGKPIVLAGARNVMKWGYADGLLEAVLPPGEVKIKLEKGFEYKPAEQTIDLDDDKNLTMGLSRWVDMPAEGWYSGDTHVHWVRHTWHENGNPVWLNVHSRAEDLWVNNNLILKHWWKNVKSDEFPLGLVANRPDMFPVGKVDHLSVNGRIVWTGEEYRNDEVFGHLNFLRIDRLIEPVSTGFMGGPDAVHYPPNSMKYDEVHDAGGIVIAAHDMVMEVPIQVILGKLDVLDAHNTNRYYDLLNCGFRVPLSIGSDYPANLMGFARVYVYCGEKLDYDTWIDNLAAGRTFVSSGTMIRFTADGREIGDTIDLPPGKSRRIVVRGSAQCYGRLDRVEIVHNGRVVKTVAAEGEANRIDFEETILAEGPGWLAARAYPPTGQGWWGQPDAAHTSPIYLRAGDRRLIQAEAVNRLIHVLEEGKRRATASRMYKSDEQKQEVLDFYDAGIRKYEELLESAE